MYHTKQKICAPQKVWGGKFRVARRYIHEFPRRPVYCEPFLGGGSVGLNIDPAMNGITHQYFSDIHPGIIRIFKTLAHPIHGSAVAKILQEYPYRQDEFEQAKKLVGHKDDRVHTLSMIAANRMSSQGLGKVFAESDRLRGGQMGDKNAWENFCHKHIYGLMSRLQSIKIGHHNAFGVIANLAEYHDEGVLFFLDPPYMHESRVSKDAYEYEFTVDDHIKLLDLIIDINIRMPQHKFFLCGYHTELYKTRLVDEAGWSYSELLRPTDSSRSKTKTTRTEVLWESP